MGPKSQAKAKKRDKEVQRELAEGKNIEDCSAVVAWMLEPHRSPSVKKWSGSYQHGSQRTDKIHETMNCFSHFVYEWTKKSIVFADLQSEVFSCKC